MPIKNAFCQCLHLFSLCTWAQSYFVLTKVEQTSLNQISMFYITISFRWIMFVSSLLMFSIFQSKRTGLFLTILPSLKVFRGHKQFAVNTSGFWFLLVIQHPVVDNLLLSALKLLKGKVYSTVFILNEMYLCSYWCTIWLNTLGV